MCWTNADVRPATAPRPGPGCIFSGFATRSPEIFARSPSRHNGSRLRSPEVVGRDVPYGEAGWTEIVSESFAESVYHGPVAPPGSPGSFSTPSPSRSTHAHTYSSLYLGTSSANASGRV